MHLDGPARLPGRRMTTAPPMANDDRAGRGSERVRVDGKFLRRGTAKFWVKGVTYGPFAPNAAGFQLPEAPQIEADFRQLRELGANTLRVYHVPPRTFLDQAQAHGLKVLVDVPWSKHRCFLDNRADRETGRKAVREAARSCREHPALLALSVANEIPPDVARWSGPREGRALHRRAGGHRTAGGPGRARHLRELSARPSTCAR